MEILAEKEAVAQLIPQKFPFEMVDKLFSYTESKVVAGLLVSAENIFTVDGIFRESGLIEHMAQSVALHTGYKFYLRKEAAPTGYIGSISALEISNLPKIGDEIVTTVDILQEFGDITMVGISSSVKGLEIAKGQMKTVARKMTLSNIDITKYLPHRAPFLMVDVITRLEDEAVETTFKILPDNIFVDTNGNFVEAGLVENAAQNCAAIVAKGFFVDENLEDKPDAQVIGFISAIKTLKVFKLPKSGDTITTKSTLVSNFATDDYSLCTMQCQTFVGETLLLEGEINLFIQQQAPIVAKSNI